MRISIEEVPSPVDNGPAVLIHGGAWAIPDEECLAHEAGLQQAVERAKTMLLEGAQALDVVCETVAFLESHGAFDAGRGAVLTREGTIELDAGIMEGQTLRFGAVANVKRIANPVRAARLVLAEGQGDFRFLAGEQAELFAQEQGLHLVENSTLISERERLRYLKLKKAEEYRTSHPFRNSHPKGTVGCVALDQKGHIAAATSTGGTPYRRPGRVGDSPICGAGYYANWKGGASATGWGEAIATIALCFQGISNLDTHSPAEAAGQALTSMYETVQDDDGEGGTGGLLIMSKDGSGACAFTTPRMARAGWSQGRDMWWKVT